VKIRVLGASAGGGLPQWNCGGPNSVRARGHDADMPRRTQSSIAISSDDERWSLINASPDVRSQLADFPGLHPRPGTRDIPLDSVVVTNADLDHTLGLLILRESLPYQILTTPWIRRTLLDHNATFRLLEPAFRTVALDHPFPLDREGVLEAKLFPVPGELPIWARELAKGAAEANLGLRVIDKRTGRRLVYAPSLRSLDSGTLAELEQADLRFVDGTFFAPNELLAMRPGAPDAYAMGHTPITGAGGSLERVLELPGRTLYIGMNNTNPILDFGSRERAEVRDAGIEIADDGMTLSL